MARIRYLKPEFFEDENIADLPFETRLCFQGLWVNADREGRLENKPRWLKIKIFPYDKIEIEKQLTILEKKPFIIRYSVDDFNYIQILNFHKHQKPHHTERESVIPKYDGELTVNEPLQDESTTSDSHLAGLLNKEEGKEEGKEKDISSQIENLLISFESHQETIQEYLNGVASTNQSKKITDGRKRTLLLELINSRERCNNDNQFYCAVDGALKYKAYNIGYVNSIIRNKKTQVVEK